MANARRAYGNADEMALTTQVGGNCPLCGHALFRKKGPRWYKHYELAHIYPLNPTAQELEILQDVYRLCNDVNHVDNLIPLCVDCHARFDKPRTRVEYEQLCAIKRRLVDSADARALGAAFTIESSIRLVISNLQAASAESLVSYVAELEFDPKVLDKKFDQSLPLLIRQKIRHGVADYYRFIKLAFRDLERDTPMSSHVIYCQVRAFYLKQKSLGFSQPVIFANVVDWLKNTTRSDSVDAVEVVAAFFVQNCEVFD